MRSGTFDSGIVEIAVPDGWMAFCGIDSECRTTPKKVHVFKDAELETDIFTHAGLTVCFYGPEDSWLSPKCFYDNVSDMEPFVLGTYTWRGYTCSSFGYPYTMLETECDGCIFFVMILTKNGGHEVSLQDPDVENILKSLKITNNKE